MLLMNLIRYMKFNKVRYNEFGIKHHSGYLDSLMHYNE